MHSSHCSLRLDRAETYHHKTCTAAAFCQCFQKICGVQEAHREEAQRRREVQAELFDLQGPVQVLCRLHNDADDKSDNESVGHQDCNADPYAPSYKYATALALGICVIDACLVKSDCLCIILLSINSISTSTRSLCLFPWRLALLHTVASCHEFVGIDPHSAFSLALSLIGMFASVRKRSSMF